MIVYQIFSDPINPVWCFYLNKINIDFTDIIPVKQSNISIPGSRECLFSLFQLHCKILPVSPFPHRARTPHNLDRHLFHCESVYQNGDLYRYICISFIFFFLISHGSQYETVPQTQSAGLTEPGTFASTVLDIPMMLSVELRKILIDVKQI